MKLRRWKTTEETVLRQHYRSLGADCCADMLGRSVVAVFCRAHKLRLTDDQRTAQLKARARAGL